jgi:DNA-binding MurR/RpiR family transcriptional regulator
VVRAQTVAKTLSDPPPETTHWTAAMIAEQVGISVSSVQRIWRAHGLQPHRTRQLRLSPERQLVEKLRDRPFSIDPWRATGLIFGWMPPT